MQLYSARYLLPIGRPPLEDGALLVADGLIHAVGQRRELAAAHPGAAAVDFGDCVLLPAMANAHTHLELTDFPAWAAQDGESAPTADFVEWIRHLVQVRKARNDSEFGDSLANGLRATLAAGVGMVGDILTRLDAAEAYRRSPLRGRVFCEVLGRDAETVAVRLADIERLVSSPCAASLTWGLAPHAPYSLSDATAAKVGAFARDRDLQIALHLAETRDEVEFLERGSGAIADRLYASAGWQRPPRSTGGPHPVAWARRQNVLPAGSLAVHGVHVGEAEINLLAASDCSVALCPRSNSTFDETRAPVRAYRDAGINLALGTDSLASAPSLSIWEELAFACRWFRGLLDPEVWLEIATLGGARALGLAEQAGSLQSGKEASFQVVATPDCGGLPDLAEALCAMGESVQVREFLLGGQPVLPRP